MYYEGEVRLRPITHDPELSPETLDVVGVDQYRESGDVEVDASAIQTVCAAVRNGNPVHWFSDDSGPLVAPSTSVSTWVRPHIWRPGGTGHRKALQSHFDLKERLGLSEAVVTDTLLVADRPIEQGERLSSSQRVLAIGPEKSTRIGAGRFWDIELRYQDSQGRPVGSECYRHFAYLPHAQPPAKAPSSGATRESRMDAPAAQWSHTLTTTDIVLGAISTRDWQPQHHDASFATTRAGVANVFLNNPAFQGWVESFIGRWLGHSARVRQLWVQILDQLFPGQEMRFTGAERSREPGHQSSRVVDVVVLADERVVARASALMDGAGESDASSLWRR